MVAVKIKHFKRLIDQKKSKKNPQKAIFSRTWQAGITFWLRKQDFAPFRREGDFYSKYLAIHAQGFGLPCISGTGNNLVFKVILSY